MPNLIDLTGQRFGRLTVLYRAPNQGKRVMWHCKCDCGVEKDISSSLLRAGKTQSCGCLHKELLSQRSIPNLVGQRFGKLIVLEQTNERRDQKVVWKCQCDCGNITYAITKHLRSGEVKSCGCLAKKHRQKFGEQNIKNITGQRFGRLTAIRPLLEYETTSGGRMWECKCDCGNIIHTRIHNLTDGSTQSCGCIKSKGEAKIQQILQENNITFEKQKTFNSCKSPISNLPLYFDFYLPQYNLLIEYDGEQHFFATEQGWNNSQNFEQIQIRDQYKTEWAKNHNIQLIRIPYTKYSILNLQIILGEQ